MLSPDRDDAADLIDEDGRPVGEIGSVRYPDVATEVGACPYADARHGRPMNRSALRQLSLAWSEVRSTVAAMAARASRPGTVAGAWQTALAGTAIPAVWSRQHPGEPVPRRWSAIYKTSLGFSQVTTAMLLSDDGVADCALGSLGSPDEFLELLDRERWLVGEQQVCAGPSAWIAELFGALASPAPADLPLDVAAIGRRRATWVALQVAFVGAARALPGASVAPRLPCLRVAQARPGREPGHARRLFARGDVPEAVERFLDGIGSLDLAALEHRRDEAAAAFV